jgi:hypothetical protein
MTLRRPILRRLAPLAALALLAGCPASAPGPQAEATAMPADFAVRYAWSTGSLPPQYQYSYSVHLGPGSEGRIEFQPGYSGPIWTERFPVSEAQLRALYATLRERGVWDRKWPEGPAMAGAAGEWLEATAGGRRARLPDMPRDEDRAALREVYDSVTALVPAGVIDGLVERRKQLRQ